MNEFKIQDTKLKVSTSKADTLIIKSFPADYNVHFTTFYNTFSEDQVVLVDKNVKDIYNITHDKLIVIEAKEENKNINTVLSICETLLSYNFDKGHTLIVIGGGIIQDLGAFTAKTYKRGINWIYIPTTLLSQCDSCIGGKTALNFQTYKNQLALFSAPSKVIIDTSFLKTLTDQDVTSGYGEIIKLFLTGGEWYIRNFDKFNIDELVFHSLSIKKSVIELDEFEKCERKSLNYGHSFGHVIETMSNYKIPHGEAVMLGIELINRIYTNSDVISTLINKFTSLDKLKNIDIKKLVNGLKTDKKVSNNIISLVVVNEPGTTVFVDQYINEVLERKVYEIFTN
jgi:3-dehydroquinate synthase